MINGIKTKLDRYEGYWRLLIADPVQAAELAKQVPSFMAHLDLDNSNMVLATMTRNDFIHDRPNWQIQDWRIAPHEEVISPWLCSNHHSEAYVHEKWIGTPELKKITDGLRNVEFDGTFESTGKVFHRIRWNNYRGVSITEERYLPNESFGETHVWKFGEARSMMSEIKNYWAEFRGESIMEAKRPNPFCNGSVHDIIMAFGGLERSSGYISEKS